MKTVQKIIRPENIMAAIYIALIIVSLASLVWAIASGEISLTTLKNW